MISGNADQERTPRVRANASEMARDTLAVLEFTVDRPLSINRKYARGKLKKGSRGLYTTQKFKLFESRIKFASREALRTHPEWPRDPWLVAHCRLSYQLYDYAGDTDGPRKALKDACERVLFASDKLVEDGDAPLPIKDGNGARVVVRVQLLTVRTPAEALKLRVRADADRERRVLKRIQKATAK